MTTPPRALAEVAFYKACLSDLAQAVHLPLPEHPSDGLLVFVETSALAVRQISQQVRGDVSARHAPTKGTTANLVLAANNRLAEIAALRGAPQAERPASSTPCPNGLES